jgi:1-phosphatidylinositol phosphodiesterase
MNDLTSDTNTKDWMSKVHDDVTLCQMTIPGTHDSASFARLSGNNMNPLNDYYKCQDRDFRQQLEDGIRFFDFRGYAGTFATGGPRLGFCHGDMLDPRFDYWFDEALDIFTEFLKEHDKETIIIIPKRDYRDGKEFQNAWNRAYGINGVLIDDYNSRKVYPWFKGKELCPRLGDVRRHLVFFSRQSPDIELEVPGPNSVIPVWRDNTDNAGQFPFQIQDWSRVVADGDSKSHVIDLTIDKALKDSGQNQYWINFLSCIGNVNGLDGPPRDMAVKINHGHMQTLLRRPFGRLGILVMDFYKHGNEVEHNVMAQISSNLRKEGTVIGWYSLHNRARNDAVLDASSRSSDRIYISRSNNDCTTWKITHRDKDGWFSLYNREQKGFLDGGGNLYIRQSSDWDVSDYARWKLVPVQDSIYFLIQNRARFLAGDPNQYLDANGDIPGAYPYLGSFTGSTYAHWRFQRTIWD